MKDDLLKGAKIPGGVIDSDNILESIEEKDRLDESAELGEAELRDEDCMNGMPSIFAAGSKLVSKDSKGKDSD